MKRRTFIGTTTGTAAVLAGITGRAEKKKNLRKLSLLPNTVPKSRIIHSPVPYDENHAFFSDQLTILPAIVGFNSTVP